MWPCQQLPATEAEYCIILPDNDTATLNIFEHGLKMFIIFTQLSRVLSPIGLLGNCQVEKEDRRLEAIEINKSLSALGDVIEAYVLCIFGCWACWISCLFLCLFIDLLRSYLWDENWRQVAPPSLPSQTYGFAMAHHGTSCMAPWRACFSWMQAVAKKKKYVPYRPDIIPRLTGSTRLQSIHVTIYNQL